MIGKDNWCILLTKENEKYVIDYLNRLMDQSSSYENYGYFWGVRNGKCSINEKVEKVPFTTVITFEEFKQYILNEAPIEEVYSVFN